jgi:hypothetical protein
MIERTHPFINDTIENGQLAGSQLVKMHWKIKKKQGESNDLHQFNPDIFSKGKKVAYSLQLVAAGDEKEAGLA